MLGKQNSCGTSPAVIPSDELAALRFRPKPGKQTRLFLLATLLDLCVSSLRRGHANLLCIVPILSKKGLGLTVYVR